MYTVFQYSYISDVFVQSAWYGKKLFQTCMASYPVNPCEAVAYFTTKENIFGRD